MLLKMKSRNLLRVSLRKRFSMRRSSSGQGRDVFDWFSLVFILFVVAMPFWLPFFIG